jgi:hypothetical protein
MAGTADQSGATAIRPFQVGFSQDELTDLRRRITVTRWPERETVTDDSQGVPLAMMQELSQHWATDYDWSSRFSANHKQARIRPGSRACSGAERVGTAPERIQASDQLARRAWKSSAGAKCSSQVNAGAGSDVRSALIKLLKGTSAVDSKLGGAPL